MSFKTPHLVRRAAYERALSEGDPEKIRAAREELDNYPPDSPYDVLDGVYNSRRSNQGSTSMPAVVLVALCVVAIVAAFALSPWFQ